MKKIKLRTVLPLLATGVLAITLLNSCGKDKSSPTPGTSGLNFKTTDFKVTISNPEINADNYHFDYEVKNLKNEAYGDDYNDGDYWIRFRIKTTDGTEYQDEDFIENLTANGAFTEYGDIYFPTGKAVDVSTFKYEVYLND